VWCGGSGRARSADGYGTPCVAQRGVVPATFAPGMLWCAAVVAPSGECEDTVARHSSTGLGGERRGGDVA